MPPRKGMSHDDKMITMQRLMMESKDVWTLKELEKECPKKGITAMSVKDILQELVDNDLVSFDKIGSGNFYWCFPSEAYNRRQVAREKLAASISSMEEEIAQLEAQITELEPGREDSEERTQLDSEISEIQKQLDEVSLISQNYEALNPEAIRTAQRQADIAFNAANRWTDNIFTIKSWCIKKFNIQSAMFDKNFGLDETFDYFA